MLVQCEFFKRKLFPVRQPEQNPLGTILYSVHCPKNNLKIRTKTEPVTAVAEAAVHIRGQGGFLRFLATPCILKQQASVENMTQYTIPKII